MDNKKGNKKGVKIELSGIKSPVLPEPVMGFRGDIITWGDKNNYPDVLRHYYNYSSVHQSILNTKNNYVGGTGVYSDNSDARLQDFLKKCNEHGDSFQDILDKIIFDFLLYNGFAVQVQFTKATGKIFGLYYVPLAKLRFTKDKKKIVFCEDWTGYRAVNKQYHDIFDPGDKTGTRIYYCTGKHSIGPYPQPSYSGALADIYASTEISRYHARKMATGMFADLYIEMVGAEPTEDEKKEIERKFTKKFSGTEAEQSLIFGYAENKDLSLRIEALPNADPDGKRYIDLRKAVTESIITAHQITSPALLAIPNTGLSFGSEYQDVFNIFTNTYVNPTVKDILKPLNKLLEINFQNPGLKIAPLPSLNTQLTDENLITGNMTTEEVRRQLKKTGQIDKVEYEPGTLNKEQGQQPAGVETAISNLIKKQTDAIRP